jgi:hypothetical protein
MAALDQGSRKAAGRSASRRQIYSAPPAQSQATGAFLMHAANVTRTSIVTTKQYIRFGRVRERDG